jgi:hypothetical protein
MLFMIPYIELCKDMQGKYISYSMLLNTIEWDEKRKTITARDGHHCNNCGKGETTNHFSEELKETVYFWEVGYVDYPILEDAGKPYFMQVHHKHYILNRLPWDYEDKDFETLCNWCHWDFHLNNKVKVYGADGVTLLEDLKPCLRCNGAGSFPKYSHVQGGVCFRCNGQRYEQPLVNIVG